MRVAGLLARGAVLPPRRILVLTFSNRARDNIRRRLAEHVGGAVLRSRVTVANLHGLASRLIRAHGEVIGLDPAFQLPSSDWVSEECRLRRLTFREVDVTKGILQRVKHQPITDAEVGAELLLSGDPHAIAIECDRISAHVLTYDDLLRLGELILANEVVRTLYAQHFACVVVDEFQDLTPQQLRVINRLGYGRTTYAGDLAQGIFGFAGADPEAILATIRAEVAISLPLTASYRASPAVVQAVNALIPLTGGTRLECADHDSWPGGGLATACAFADTYAEAAWCVSFAQLVLARAPQHRVGVIGRTTSRRRFADDAFAASGLQSHRWDDPLLDGVARSVVGAGLTRVRLDGFRAADDRVAYLVDCAAIETLDDPDTRLAVRDAMGWVADELSNNVSMASIAERIARATLGTGLQSPGVHLLSGHIGKGQQFDWVIVIGAEDGCIPFFLARSDEAVREEARVLSVMVSRARHGVVITSANEVEALNGTVHSRDVSTFVDLMKQGGALSPQSAARAWIDEVDWEAVALR